MTPDKRVEEILLKRVLYIGDNEWKLKGYPQELIDELTQHHQDIMSEVMMNIHRMRTKVECQEDIGWNNALDDLIKSLSNLSK